MHSERSGVEYNATSLDGLFCQRRNLVSPRFWGMLADLRRFYRDAPLLLAEGEGPTLGQYLHSQRYGAAFIDEHLLPMASALWSSPTDTVMQFPARYLAQFMANHQMLQMTGRAPWRVVSGGSARYVDALRARWRVRERLECPVHSVERMPWGARVHSAAGVEGFDEVIWRATATERWPCCVTPIRSNATCSAPSATRPTKQYCIPTHRCCRATARHGPHGMHTFPRSRRALYGQLLHEPSAGPAR